jgi:hypothetical protein
MPRWAAPSAFPEESGPPKLARGLGDTPASSGRVGWPGRARSAMGVRRTPESPRRGRLGSGDPPAIPSPVFLSGRSIVAGLERSYKLREQAGSELGFPCILSG